MTSNQRVPRVILWLSIFAGSVYNSWPIGFLVNRRVVDIGLASDLEASGQPYNWLFVTLDVVASVALLLIACALFADAKKSSSVSRAWPAVALGLLFFGIFTVLSAVIPLRCQNSIAQCGVSPNQLFSLHNVLGAVAALGYFVSLLAIAIVNFKRSKWAKWAGLTILVLWSVVGLIYLAFIKSTRLRFIQDIFLLLTGVGIAVIGLVISAKVNSPRGHGGAN